MTVQPMTWAIQGQPHDAETARSAMAAVFGVPAAAHTAAVTVTTAGGGHGVTGSTDLSVTQNGTPNMSVNVAAGRAVIRAGHAGNITSGVWPFLNDATVNLLIAAADATNPRYDLVVAQVRDTNYGEAASAPRLTVVTGTPAASPADPALTSYPNCLVLARVRVDAAVTSIVTAKITDLRSWATAVGGTRLCYSTTRPTVTWAGLEIFEIDTLRKYVHNGSGWVFVSHLAREDQQWLTYVPGGNVDANTAAAWNDWVTIGNLSVPTWATKARVAMAASGLTYTGAVSSQFGTRLKIGTAVGGTQHNFRDPNGYDFGYTLLDNVTLAATGTLSLKIQSYRIAGTGQWRANANSRFDVWADYC